MCGRFVSIFYSDSFLVWLLNSSEQNKPLEGVPENIFYCDFETVQVYLGACLKQLTTDWLKKFTVRSLLEVLPLNRLFCSN